MATVADLTVAFGTKGVEGVSRALSDVGGKVDAVGAKSKMGAGLLLGMGAAVVGGFGLAVKSAMSFESGLSNVAAALGGVDVAGGITNEVFAQLSDEALRIGETTTQSATGATQAMELLAKAGISYTEILDGAAQSAVNLAEATGEMLPQAAESLAAVMTLFQDQGLSSARTTDIITQGMNQSSASLSEFQTGYARLAPVIAQTNMPLEESTALLAYFNAQGLGTAETGTSLTSMFTNLTQPVGAAGQAIHDMGLDVYDLEGNFVGIPAMFDQLAVATAGMTEEQRTLALGLIFGADAMDVVSLGLKNNMEGYDALRVSMDAEGVAAEASRTRMNNLGGDMENLRGVIESLSIRVGRMLTPSLRGLTQGITRVLSAFGRMPSGAQRVIVTLVAAAAAVAALAGGIVLLTAGANVLAPGLAALGGAFAILLSPIGLLAAAAVGLAIVFRGPILAGVSELGDRLGEFVGDVTDVYDRLREGEGYFDEWSNSWIQTEEGASRGNAAIRAFGSGLEDLLGIETSAFFGNLAQAWDALTARDWSTFWDEVKQAIGVLDLETVSVRIGGFVLETAVDLWGWMRDRVLGGASDNVVTGGPVARQSSQEGFFIDLPAIALKIPGFTSDTLGPAFALWWEGIKASVTFLVTTDPIELSPEIELSIETKTEEIVNQFLLWGVGLILSAGEGLSGLSWGDMVDAAKIAGAIGVALLTIPNALGALFAIIFGAVIGQVFRSLFQGAFGSLAKIFHEVWDPVWEDITGVFSDLSIDWDSFGNPFDGFGDWITGAWDEAVSAVKPDVPPWLGALANGDLFGAVKLLGGNAPAGTQGLGPGGFDADKEATRRAAAQAAFQAWDMGGPNGNQSATGNFVTMLPTVGGGGPFGGALGGISQGIQGLLKDTQKVPAPDLSGFTAAFTDAAAAITTATLAIESRVTAMAASVSTMAANAAAGFNNLFRLDPAVSHAGAVQASLDSIFQGIGTTSTVMGGVSSAGFNNTFRLEPSVSHAGAVQASLAAIFVGIAATATVMGFNAGAGFAAGIWAGMSNAVAAAGAAAGAIQGALSMDLYGLGLNASMSFANGLWAGVGSAQAAAGALATAAAQGLAAKLMLGSPSRLFMGYADDTIDGWLLPWQKRKGEAAAAAGALVGIPAGAAFAPPALAGGAGGGRGPAPITIQNHNHFHGDIYDGEKFDDRVSGTFVRKVAPAMVQAVETQRRAAGVRS